MGKWRDEGWRLPPAHTGNNTSRSFHVIIIINSDSGCDCSSLQMAKVGRLGVALDRNMAIKLHTSHILGQRIYWVSLLLGYTEYIA